MLGCDNADKPGRGLLLQAIVSLLWLSAMAASTRVAAKPTRAVLKILSRPGQGDGYLHGLVNSHIGKSVLYACAWVKKNSFIIKFQIKIITYELWKSQTS